MGSSELERMCVSVLRLLVPRRDYFVSGVECHCFLRCLCCGSVAYPPTQKHIAHSDGCLFSKLFHEFTKCSPPQILARAHSIDGEDKVSDDKETVKSPTPPLIEADTQSIDIAPLPYSRRDSSGNFSFLKSSDRCNSFNAFVAANNTPTPTPTPNALRMSSSMSMSNAMGNPPPLPPSSHRRETLSSRRSSFALSRIGMGNAMDPPQPQSQLSGLLTNLLTASNVNMSPLNGKERNGAERMTQN